MKFFYVCIRNNEIELVGCAEYPTHTEFKRNLDGWQGDPPIYRYQEVGASCVRRAFEDDEWDHFTYRPAPKGWKIEG